MDAEIEKPIVCPLCGLPSGTRRKITDEDVRRIRQRFGAGETHAALGKAFGVTPSTISHVVNRQFRFAFID